MSDAFNFGLHGFVGLTDENFHVEHPGPVRLGRDLEWSKRIAEVLSIHMHATPPEVALDALGLTAALLATAIVTVDTTPIEDEMRETLAAVGQRVFHHDPLHALVGISLLCSATVARYVAGQYPTRDPAGMH